MTRRILPFGPHGQAKFGPSTTSYGEVVGGPKVADAHTEVATIERLLAKELRAAPDYHTWRPAYQSEAGGGLVPLVAAGVALPARGGFFDLAQYLPDAGERAAPPLARREREVEGEGRRDGGRVGEGAGQEHDDAEGDEGDRHGVFRCATRKKEERERVRAKMIVKI